MNCLDCTINERPPAPAVGVCHSCGAAVCASCVRLTVHAVPQPTTVGNPVGGEVRALSCASCDAALREHGAAPVSAAAAR